MIEVRAHRFVDRARVRFLTPEEFVSFLEELEAEGAGKEGTVRGYKVKVKYKTVTETEKKTRPVRQLSHRFNLEMPVTGVACFRFCTHSACILPVGISAAFCRIWFMWV